MDNLPISHGSEGELPSLPVLPQHDFTTRIPSELLLAIFTLTLPNDDDDYEALFPSTTSLSISLVCVRWREVALGLSHLWTHIHIHWPMELAQLYIQRAGPDVPLSFSLEDGELDAIANKPVPFDRYDHNAESDDDYAPSEHSDSDSEVSAIIDDEEIQGMQSEAAGPGHHGLPPGGQGYYDSDDSGDDSGDDSSDSDSDSMRRPGAGAVALLQIYQCTTPAAFFYDRKILARIRSIRFDRRNYDPAATRWKSFTGWFMHDIQEIIHGSFLPSLQSYTHADYDTGDLKSRVDRVRFPHLRHLSLSHSTLPLSGSWFPSTLRSLELYSVKFVGSLDAWGDDSPSLDWFNRTKDRAPTDLLHLRRLTIEMASREVKEFFRSVNLPSTVRVRCTVKVSRYGRTGRRDVADLVNQASDALSFFPKTFKLSADRLQTLRVDTARDGGNPSITLLDPSDTDALPPNLIIEFSSTYPHGHTPYPFPGLDVFEIQPVLGILCHSVTRLVVNSLYTSPSSNGTQCVDELVQRLNALQAVEILGVSRHDLFNILLEASDRTLQLLSNYSLINSDRDEQVLMQQLNAAYKTLARVNAARDHRDSLN